MKIGNREIFMFAAPYIIAEIGANHNGDMEICAKLVRAAKECGCDAVKFQSWTPDSLIAREEYDRNQKYDDSPKKHFGSLREMVEKYYLREDQHRDMKKLCDEIGIVFVSTPFSPKEADFLNELDVAFYKIASMDVNNLEFLRHVARKNKPILLSTGMATLSEIAKAVEVLESEQVKDLILLHCIAVYPPALEDVNLNNIPMLQNAFGYPVGFSDHSIGTTLPLASVALGSCVIEKHFTLDKNMPGWDHDISADPVEMKVIVKESKKIVKALGSYKRVVNMSEEEKKMKFRRSVVTRKELKKGHILSAEDLTFKRPGTGIPPDEARYIFGRRLQRDLSQDQLIDWTDLD